MLALPKGLRRLIYDKTVEIVRAENPDS